MATGSPVRICPTCEGNGTVAQLPVFKNGRIVLQPELDKDGRIPECPRCHGDGYIWVGAKQHP